MRIAMVIAYYVKRTRQGDEHLQLGALGAIALWVGEDVNLQLQ